MASKIHHPHDAFFRQAMSDVRVAKDFFEQHLPKNLLQQVDLTQLKFQKTSFIEAEFKQSSADVIYQIPIAKQPGYLYCLVEHQSKPEKLLPFRVLKYKMNIMQHHLEQTGNKELPVVYAMVFYTGNEKYKEPTDIFELFGAHKALAEQSLFRPFQLIDVQQISDEELQQHLWAGIFEFIYKHRCAKALRNMEKILGMWLTALENQQGFEYAVSMIKYMLSMVDQKDAEEFVKELIPHLSENLEDETMTLAEQLERKGLQRGMQLEKQHIAQNLLRKNILSIKDIAEATGLSFEEIEQLEKETVS